ncbi:hypothetical protein C9994_10600 [Marivirga lumbricoides]|uniref:Uncharacterized protein n=1 Tax=Marivirga lumbricoides TaxID=1046115 RepID=A0A2T4DPE4_9BACT|nr:hypothetical protein C9994_10600 [Marivirga lumbricoides]
MKNDLNIRLLMLSYSTLKVSNEAQYAYNLQKWYIKSSDSVEIKVGAPKQIRDNKWYNPSKIRRGIQLKEIEFIELEIERVEKKILKLSEMRKEDELNEYGMLKSKEWETILKSYFEFLTKKIPKASRLPTKNEEAENKPFWKLIDADKKRVYDNFIYMLKQDQDFLNAKPFLTENKDQKYTLIEGLPKPYITEILRVFHSLLQNDYRGVKYKNIKSIWGNTFTNQCPSEKYIINAYDIGSHVPKPEDFIVPRENIKLILERAGGKID